MAKKEEKTSWKQLIAELNRDGPSSIYLLWGPEDYLREEYVKTLKKRCLSEGEDEFSYRRMRGGATMRELSDAVNSMPFLSERTFVEVRGFELSKCDEEDTEALVRILSDVPEWCTLCFVIGADGDIDWRKKAALSLKKYARVIKFTGQEQGDMLRWLQKRFAALGKTADPRALQHLMFLSGEYMSALVPEVEKIAAAVEGESVTVEDVEKYAHHIPEARAFEMTDRMAARDYDAAAACMAELIASGEEAQKTMGAIGMQFRRLYAAKVAQEERLGAEFICELYPSVRDYAASKIMDTARRFKLKELSRAVELCAETAYGLNSSGGEPTELLKELLVKLACGGAA